MQSQKIMVLVVVVLNLNIRGGGRGGFSPSAPQPLSPSLGSIAYDVVFEDVRKRASCTRITTIYVAVHTTLLAVHKLNCILCNVILLAKTASISKTMNTCIQTSHVRPCVCKYSVGVLCEVLKYASFMGFLVTALTPKVFSKITTSVFENI